MRSGPSAPVPKTFSLCSSAALRWRCHSAGETFSGSKLLRRNMRSSSRFCTLSLKAELPSISTFGSTFSRSKIVGRMSTVST